MFCVPNNHSEHYPYGVILIGGSWQQKNEHTEYLREIGCQYVYDYQVTAYWPRRLAEMMMYDMVCARQYHFKDAFFAAQFKLRFG